MTQLIPVFGGVGAAQATPTPGPSEPFTAILNPTCPPLLADARADFGKRTPVLDTDSNADPHTRAGRLHQSRILGAPMSLTAIVSTRYVAAVLGPALLEWRQPDHPATTSTATVREGRSGP